MNVFPGTRPNGSVPSKTYDATSQITDILELAPDGKLLAYFKLDPDEAGRVKSEFIAPIPKDFAESPQAIVPDEDNRIKTFNGTTVVHDCANNQIMRPS